MNSTVLEPLETVLVADFGRNSTRGYVLEQIGRTFRFVAKAERPTTADAPFAGFSAGWTAMVDDLSWMTGRQVEGPLSANGDGADAMLCVSTIAAPTRVLLIETGVNSSGTTCGSIAARSPRASHGLMLA